MAAQHRNGSEMHKNGASIRLIDGPAPRARRVDAVSLRIISWTRRSAMFQRILLPIDGSACASAAVEKAIALAKAFSGAVTPICVIEPYPFTSMGADFGYEPGQYLDAARADANAAIAAAQAKFDAAGIAVQPRTVQAHAIWRGIIDTAHEESADLIVMGSHGRRGLEKLVLGSVAQSVLAHSDISTLIVRADAG
jgi:nucleotide-binding universal stress UspA family protein